ncbi:hypothetical protein HT576_05380 [Haloterrigena sp. SYSU A121-1]|uniref:Uncharacterized protein n=1 Tax=Haloterrigena gelatinilytica TaxID=2741724 RepID=A0A8J8GJP7_9EURY|nr:hypothetical protein [Haloterrigena gelatinilytica]
MHRRALLASSTTILFAGCSEVTNLMGDGYVDQTVQDEQTAGFDADAGEELTVTVENIDVAEADNESTVQPDAISFRLDHAEEGPVMTESISEPTAFDVTIETGGAHVVIVTNGAADVTVEPSE